MVMVGSARRLLAASTLALSGWLLAQPGMAGDNTAAGMAPDFVGTGNETVIVTGTKFDAEAAPAKASLDTTEPQTILTRTYIENSVADTADYTTLLAIVPSLTGLDINGPGLSDGNVKNTLRGMPDGNFGMTYDGIPFGDTNGPTHHSESYFPGATIGSVNVERGPGNAGNLGASTWGGSVNMHSESLSDDFGVKAKVMRGSWDTALVNLNLQSGDIPGLGNTRALVNVNGVQSSGYLKLQNTVKDNELVKIESEFAPNWTLTLFANRNNLHQHAADKNGYTAAQVSTFGKQYALQKDDPSAQNYYWYNYADKITDMDYARLRGAVTDWLSIDDQAYTYAYVNKTATASDVRQTVKSGVLTWNTAITTTDTSGVKHAGDVPGYTKLNAYRVWGNVFRAAADFDAGFLTGQLRAGVWWEGQATERERYYFDWTQCQAAGCQPFHQAWNFADISSKSASNDPNLFMGRYGIGYKEHTGWSQVEPFVEIELHPLADLTITPGFKYVDWDHTIAADSIVSGTSPSNTTGCAGACKGPGLFNGVTTKYTTTRPLYFATVNYKIQPSWSAYFQYATGIYVNDITDFEQQKPDLTKAPSPMTTANYQFGTVYYADDFSVDADIYYVAAKHNYTYGPCTYDATLTCATDTGNATYKGIEGEASYKLDAFLPGLTDGLLAFANGSINSAKSGFAQLKSAPYWTAAAGLIYKRDAFSFSLIDKTVGQQYMDNADATGTRKIGLDGGAFYRTPAYSTVNLITSYQFGKFAVSVAVNNLLDDRSLVGLSGSDAKDIATAASVSDVMHRLTSTDQYYYQSSRSYQVTLKASL